MKFRVLPGATMLLAALSVAASSAAAQRIQMPVGYRLTWIGARWNPEARVVDPRTGRPVAASLAYRIADPAIASVSNRGEVTARKPGRTILWAVSGRDSASALIVVEQWPARFTFSPSAVRLDAVGARQPVRVLASDSSGTPMVGESSRANACRSVNDRVATLAGDTVVSVANGSTWIRCAERGIADSIRVDVQQRAVSLRIMNKAPLSRRAAGDTFRVNVSTLDRLQKEVAGARPTYVSLNPLAVSVDPLSGRGRAVNGGEARVIAQVGDVADSVSINVTGSTYQPVAAVVSTDTTNKSRAQLLANEIFAYEAETTFVNITAFDSAGQQAPITSVSFRILDTTIAAPVDSANIVGRKAGSTSMIVRYGTLVDTSRISVATRSSQQSSGSAIDAAADGAPFSPPTIPDSTSQYQQAKRDADRQIHTDPNTASARQGLVINTSAFGSIAEHLVRTDAGVTEDRTGPLFGGTGSLLLFQRLELAAALRLGSLASVDTVGEDISVTEFEGTVGYFPLRNLGLRAGAMLRSEKSEIAGQGWFIPKISLITRFGFIGDIVSTFAAVSVLPKAKFSGLTERGSLGSLGGEAGLDFKRGRLAAGLTYFTEQVSFGESPRVESFSAIRLRLGFNLGR
jgi:hypothetical protein